MTLSLLGEFSVTELYLQPNQELSTYNCVYYNIYFKYDHYS